MAEGPTNHSVNWLQWAAVTPRIDGNFIWQRSQLGAGVKTTW